MPMQLHYRILHVHLHESDKNFWEVFTRQKNDPQSIADNRERAVNQMTLPVRRHRQ
jgi:hypothetical protein